MKIRFTLPIFGWLSGKVYDEDSGKEYTETQMNGFSETKHLTN